MQTLTLFVSSPGDVRDERQAVGRIVERLQARYWNFVRLEPVLWEKEPLRATAHFNEELIRPSDCDLFVCVLWSRLGSPLPSQFNRADGTRFDSGTEWELEEATEAYERRAATTATAAKPGERAAHPDILVYRRMSEPPAGPADQAEARARQKKGLDAFCQRFFFHSDGTIRRAFSPYEAVDEFAQLFEQHLEKLLLRHIRLQRGLAEEAVRPLPLEGSPFKGLGAFDFADAPLFFGRNRPIAEALDQLKRNQAAGHAFLLIYGGSGYGKSSLMRAGLAPRLTAEGYLPGIGAWRRATLLPVAGDSPAIETLARALVGALPELAKMRDRWDAARLARMLAKPDDVVLAIAALIAALDRVSAAKPAQLLVMIDQLEEIFTSPAISPPDRDAFFNVLAALALSRRIWVVATLRSEFFPRVPEHRDLFQLVRHGGGYILSPPQLPELHQIIRYPALAAGLQFERHPENGRDLSEQIYQDAADAADALPLLEFTLEELYQRRRENLLTWAAYEELGGLAGAIARRAQETFEALPSETRRDAARHLFGELVTVDATKSGPATRRRARRALLEKAHPGAPAFLEAFIAAKLLVTGSEEQVATVTLAHEALITHWPVLGQWIADHRDLLLARRRLEEATRLWLEGRRSPKFYLAEGRLSEAGRVTTCGVFQLGAEELELVRLSQVRARRQLRIFQGATAVFAALAIGAGALGYVARQRQIRADGAEKDARDAAAATRRSLAAADFEAGATRVEAGSPDEALPYLLAALEGDPANLEAQATLLDTLRRTSWNFPEIELRHPLPVRMLSFGADRSTLFAATDASSTGDGFNTTLRWDLENAAITASLAPKWGEITLTLSVGPGARHLLIQRATKFLEEPILCEADTLRMIARLPVPRSPEVPATCFAWSPDGLLLAYPARTEVKARAALVWRVVDTATGQTVRESEPFAADAPACLAAQLDRRRLRFLRADGSLTEIPLAPTEPVLTARLQDPASFAIFSPDGDQLIAAVAPGRHDDPRQQAFEISYPAEGGLALTGLALEDTNAWSAARPLRERFPWAAWESPVWERLLSRDAADDSLLRPFRIQGGRLESFDGATGHLGARAPVHMESNIEAVAAAGDRLAVGTSGGELSVQRMLPRLAPAIALQPAPAKEEKADGAIVWHPHGAGGGWQLQNHNSTWRLLPAAEAGGKTVTLQPHPNWNLVTDGAISADGEKIVLGGFSYGSAGYSSSGLVLIDPATGARLSDLEPVADIRRIVFLGASHRLAAMGAAGVVIAEAEKDGFRVLTTLPVPRASSLACLPSGLLAIATRTEVSLFDPGDFSRVATLPIAGAKASEEEPQDDGCWAEDTAHRWLAYSHGPTLDVWSLRTGRHLIGGLDLGARPASLAFESREGSLGLAIDDGFLPLAKATGLGTPEIASLRAFAETLGAARFTADSRSLGYLSTAERRQRLSQLDPHLLESLLPGSSTLLDAIRAIPARTSSAETWMPLWDRLATSSDPSDGPTIARLATRLGPLPADLQPYLRGLIATSDAELYRWLRREKPAGGADGPDHLLPEDSTIGNLHRLAGDPPATRALKEAAWLALGTTAGLAGPALADESREEFPSLDFDALSRLDPPALEALRQALEKARTRDWRSQWLEDYARRPAALALLATHVEATRRTWEQTSTPTTALAHAEALALSGDLPAAAAFLAGKLPADADLTLEQAHFLTGSGLGAAFPQTLARALGQLGSPWLRIAWLNMPGHTVPLAQRIQSTMTAVDGQGPAAVEALLAALHSSEATAIDAALQGARDLPVPLREYAIARSLWRQGRKAEVFALWPRELPDLVKLAEASDWQGWEKAVSFDETRDFLNALEQDLATLKAPADATQEQHRALAEHLLDNDTIAHFGIRRVRDAMVEEALVLARDKDSGGSVARLIERARLVGASPLLCMRAEARAFMAAGDASSAYTRWLQVMESQEGVIIPEDYLDAAACLVQDLQTPAAVELLLRGKELFADSADYFFNGAWLLLSAAQPEEAGILLELGFVLPFTADQQPIALAMLVCAAEQTQRTDRADQAYKQLLALSPDWGNTATLHALEWPESMKKSLLAVAARNR